MFVLTAFVGVARYGYKLCQKMVNYALFEQPMAAQPRVLKNSFQAT